MINVDMTSLSMTENSIKELEKHEYNFHKSSKQPGALLCVLEQDTLNPLFSTSSTKDKSRQDWTTDESDVKH